MSYFNENSFSRWIIEKSDGITKSGIKKLSESVRDYAYLILTSQTGTRSQIARSKVDFVIGEKMYMIPSDMNLRIGKIKNYNNKILAGIEVLL